MLAQISSAYKHSINEWVFTMERRSGQPVRGGATKLHHTWERRESMPSSFCRQHTAAPSLLPLLAWENWWKWFLKNAFPTYSTYSFDCTKYFIGKLHLHTFFIHLFWCLMATHNILVDSCFVRPFHGTWEDKNVTWQHHNLLVTLNNVTHF